MNELVINMSEIWYVGDPCYVILDDDDSWQEENHLATLEYKDYELKQLNN